MDWRDRWWWNRNVVAKWGAWKGDAKECRESNNRFRGNLRFSDCSSSSHYCRTFRQKNSEIWITDQTKQHVSSVEIFVKKEQTNYSSSNCVIVSNENSFSFKIYCSLVCYRILIKYKPIDSSLDVLQLWFWVKSERTDRLVANWRKVRPGVSATMWGPLLLLEFAAERLVWWHWTQKTFYRKLKGLSNGVYDHYIWWKLREIIEFCRDPWTLTERFSWQIPNFKKLPRPND